MAVKNILEWNKQQGYANPRTYSSDFMGPIRPGDSYAAPAQVLGDNTQRTSGGGNYNVGDIVGDQRWTGDGWAQHGSSGGSGEPDISALLNEEFDRGNQLLNEAESSYRDEYATDEKNIGNKFDLYGRQAKDQGTELGADVDKQEGRYGKVLGSAYEESIRDYNALNQQGRARFGGGSSAGQAVGELAQKEFFRNQGKIDDKRTEGALQFADERARIGKYVATKLDELKLYKDEALAELKKGLRQRLDDVRSQRFGLEQNRTQARLGILQDTRNQIRLLNEQDKQFRQNLGLAAVSQMQEVSGRAFTPKEIQAVMSEFGINLNVGAGRSQQGSSIARRPGSADEDEISRLGIV